MSEGPAPARNLLPVCAAHVLLVALLCADVLFLGRLPYFRDVATSYYPDYVFVASALRQGVWPLWNPTTDAGGPFLMAYPVELLLLALAGARRALAWGPPLHVLVGMCSATLLARELGLSRAASWMSGAAFGLSGFVQSSLNLFELSHGAAWAPLTIVAYLRCLRMATPRAIALLGTAAALQASTLAGEVALQTAAAAVVLTPLVPSRRQWAALASAGVVAALLAAPVVLGMRAMLEGTARGAGFAPAMALGWSVHPVVLAESLWPHFLGDPHTMTNLGYWGQPFFPDGHPYLVSLYVGPLVLALALGAGRAGARLWVLVLLGVVLALGAHGPLAEALPRLLPHFRSPVKFLFVTTLALVLLAGMGLDATRARRALSAPAGLTAVAALFLVGGLMLRLAPDASARGLAATWPPLGGPQALPVVRHLWPEALLKTGLLAAVAAGALWSRRFGLAPALCVAADLLATNAGVEPSAPASFYKLQPQVAELVARADAWPPARWFSYGPVNTEGLHWAPALLLRNHDLPLFAVDRQVLWGRAKVLDGKDGAFDEDRTGWAPAGATFTAGESRPSHHRANHARLRQAGVRFVFSFRPLPDDLVARRGEAQLPEIAEPLVLYEVRDALARAYWVPDCELVAPAGVRARLDASDFDPRRTVVLTEPPPGRSCGTAPGGGATVSWARSGPHAVELRAAGDAGYLVVLEGHHRHWQVEGGAALLRGNGRYWVLPVERGSSIYRLQFRPPWLVPALSSALLGLVAALVLAWRRGVALDTSSSAALASTD